MSHHRGGSVGVPVACQALCGLLCLTLWARPVRVDEVPGEQTLLYRKKLLSCTAAAVSSSGFCSPQLLLLFLLCSSNFLTFLVDRLRVRQSVRYLSNGIVVNIMYTIMFCDLINVLHIFDQTSIVLKSGWNSNAVPGSKG